MTPRRAGERDRAGARAGILFRRRRHREHDFTVENPRIGTDDEARAGQSRVRQLNAIARSRRWIAATRQAGEGWQRHGKGLVEPLDEKGHLVAIVGGDADVGKRSVSKHGGVERERRQPRGA